MIIKFIIILLCIIPKICLAKVVAVHNIDNIVCEVISQKIYEDGSKGGYIGTGLIISFNEKKVLILVPYNLVEDEVLFPFKIQGEVVDFKGKLYKKSKKYGLALYEIERNKYMEIEYCEFSKIVPKSLDKVYLLLKNYSIFHRINKYKDVNARFIETYSNNQDINYIKISYSSEKPPLGGGAVLTKQGKVIGIYSEYIVSKNPYILTGPSSKTIQDFIK